MCGRYTLIRLADFTDMFPWIRAAADAPPPRYNIAPTQTVAVVANQAHPHIDFFHWGLIPFWAKDASIGSRMINARSETLAEKPMFRTALKRRRCLIPTSGFYEWKKNPDGKSKTPMYIRMKGGKPFAFAGLWERWNSPDGSEVRSCTIITCDPNAMVKEIHNRMPVIVPAEKYKQWLDPEELGAEQTASFFHPYPAAQMEAYAVSRAVNNPKVDEPGLIEPAVVSEAAPAGPTSRRRGARRGPESSLFD